MGIDLGSTSSKGALLNADGELIAYRVFPSGHQPRETAARLRSELMSCAPADNNSLRCVATGYGRGMVDFADKTVTEITCHARGVRHLHPDCRSIVDIGGQDSKAILLEENGLVRDFAMNDRCAAGTGAFLDFIARRFNLSIDEVASIHSSNPEPLEVSSTCVVFAETEVVGLISGGSRIEDVLAGVQRSIARRVAQMVERLGREEPVYFSGGVALNETIRLELEKALGVPLRRCSEPQLTAAIGAALLAGK